MIPLWKSPIKLHVELPVGATRGALAKKSGPRPRFLGQSPHSRAKGQDGLNGGFFCSDSDLRHTYLYIGTLGKPVY